MIGRWLRGDQTHPVSDLRRGLRSGCDQTLAQGSDQMRMCNCSSDTREAERIGRSGVDRTLGADASDHDLQPVRLAVAYRKRS